MRKDIIVDEEYRMTKPAIYDMSIIKEQSKDFFCHSERREESLF